MSSLFETRAGAIARGALDGLAARHRAIAQNIANVETPGYTPVDVSFEDELRQLRDGGPAPQNGRLQLTSVSMQPQVDRIDGNGVSLDQEVIRLTENTLTYEAVAQAARLRGELLKSAINEGRR